MTPFVMTSAVMTKQQAAETSDNPGKILKASREALGFSLDKVAAELHLRASVVEAMEAEAYDSFSSTVFLKGYFRAYCRLLNLSEDSMVELLEKQLAARQQHLDELAAHAHKIMLHRARKKLAMVLVLSLIIAAVAGLIIDDVYQVSNPTPADIKDSVSAGVEDSANAEVDDGDAAPSVDLQSDSAEQATEQDTEQAQDAPLEQMGEGTAAELNEVDATEQSADQTEPLDAPMPDEPLADAQIQAHFRGDCWFSLKDGHNKTIAADLKHANDVVSFTGVLPFHIVLGNALQAELTLNGEHIDLKQYTAKNGRVEFTLGKES